MTKRSPEEVLLGFFDTFDAEVRQESTAGITSRGVSGLDLTLKSLLSSVLIEQPQVPKDYNAFDGPLFEFSDKWRMAYCLGLITKNEARELKLLGSIRNKCNHEIDADFNSGNISAQCRELVLGEKLHCPKMIPFPRGQGEEYSHGYDDDGYPMLPVEELKLQDPNTPSNRFVASVNVMMNILAARSSAAAYDDDSLIPHRDPPRDFEFPEEIRDLVINASEKQLRAAIEAERHFSDLVAKAAALGYNTEPLETIDPEQIKKTRVMIKALKYGGETIRRSRQHHQEKSVG